MIEEIFDYECSTCLQQKCNVSYNDPKVHFADYDLFFGFEKWPGDHICAGKMAVCQSQDMCSCREVEKFVEHLRLNVMESMLCLTKAQKSPNGKNWSPQKFGSWLHKNIKKIGQNKWNDIMFQSSFWDIKN